MEQVSYVSAKVVSHRYGWGLKNFANIQKMVPEIQSFFHVVPIQQCPVCDSLLLFVPVFHRAWTQLWTLVLCSFSFDLVRLNFLF